MTVARRYGLLEGGNALLFFGSAIGVLAWLSHDALAGQVPVGALVVAASSVGNLQGVSQVVTGGLQGLARTARNAGRLLWLRDYAVRVAAEHAGRLEPPPSLRRGIRIEGVTYRYDGSERDCLTDVELDLPAGSVVALVGENGAGKSTLVKLLSGMYEPAAGRILVDGADLAGFDLEAWRARLAGAFQDYVGFEFTALESVGVGDLTYVHDEPHVRAALRAGAAEDVVRSLPGGLATQLGTTWPDGVDLSGGQWQRLAIARGMMRSAPLLLVLDEPTAALDAATENALFERYADAARAAGDRGAVTLLVTHRFSTVAAADLVVVLDEGRVVESGTHAELVAAGGRYAELYELQARGYR